MMNYQVTEEQQGDALEERVIEIARVAKVVKGGRRFHFRVTLSWATRRARSAWVLARPMPFPMRCAKPLSVPAKICMRSTYPRQPSRTRPLGKVGGAIVLLKPASAGTGVIAAGGVRAVLEVAGVRDILTKSMGSANVLNSVQATLHALEALKSPQEEAARRGKTVEELLPFWERRKQHA